MQLTFTQPPTIRFQLLCLNTMLLLLCCSPGSALEEAVMLALDSSSSSSQRSLLQQELSTASLAVAAAEKLAATGTGFHAVLPGSADLGERQQQLSTALFRVRSP
jgi:hypothetical protein